MTQTKPLVTFVIFAYNQARFLPDAIQGAFAQTYENLEIIISDDCSQDSSHDIIQQVASGYHGPYTVRLNFNPRNLGIGEHVNRVFQLAKGDLIVFAAGDDISLPHRAQRAVDAWLAAGRTPSAVYCGGKTINESGIRTGTVNTAIASGDRSTEALIGYSRTSPLLLLGACSAYTPDVYARFAPLSTKLTVEDIPLAVRASLLGGIEYVNEELVLYRENVSVWLPRKLPSEGFERHHDRMAHRIRANFFLSQQIFNDTRSAGSRGVKRISAQRYMAAKFALQTLNARKFMLRTYVRVVRLSPYWRSSAFPAILFAFPTLHRILFMAAQFFSRKRH